MDSAHIYPVYHRTFARINLNAILENFHALRACLQSGVRTMAVIKADGYGHGSVQVAKLLETEADYFAVAELGEAIVLRNAGIQKPILVLSYTSPYQYPQLLENDITATLFNLEEAKVLSRLAAEHGTRAKVHVAVDTGMGRIGFVPDEKSADIVKEISALPGLFVEGLFSHYACADTQDTKDADAQTALFDRFIALLDARDVQIPIKHIANSAASMAFSKHYDMCRFGISLYGLYPSEEMDTQKVKLRPAMEVVSHVVHIKTVPEGFKIGYGHIYTAPAPRKIATVSIGYADGFCRCLTGVGYVLIRGKKAPVVGKVCMDQIMVDITDIDDVLVGDHAVILGENDGAAITAETLGDMCHSFNYEVVCNFMPRVVRVYHRDGILEE